MHQEEEEGCEYTLVSGCMSGGIPSENLSCEGISWH